ncbi:MAG: DUF4198 domain-containing protein [Pyrinomonadaceae bacterium]|nr:DUF4198 domain-containing protein [Pyrinomonadaceae bacterium]
MTLRIPQIVRILTLLLIFTASLSAHEFWFEADKFILKPGEVSALRLFSGQGLKKEEERPYQASKTNSFVMLSSAGTFDMRTLAEDDRKPVVNFSSDQIGTYLLSMERGWTYITLDADKFEEYLKEDGIEYILGERERLGESKKPGRERYIRFLKTIVQVGGDRTGVAKTRIGTKLEIVPQDNPYSKKVGENFSVQVYFAGLPLTNRGVFVDNRDGDALTTRKYTTDKDGKITIKLDHKGVWLVRLVHMQRCEKNCTEADWESFWGALSFGVK